MERIGNGIKWTYFARLLITGTEAIPDTLTCVDTTNFTTLNFVITKDGLIDYNAPTGVFTFKRRGLLDVSGVLNIDTAAGNTDVEIVTEIDRGTGWEKLSGRTAELQNIGAVQTTITGKIAEVDEGDKVRFFVRSPDGSASFITEALADTSVVPAVVLHMILFTR